jgi:hypothetical protein
MDSIFDEDVDEVGGEIEAYCPSPRCKADTTHTIISMYEDEVRRVQCVVCGEVHAYRKPRGDAPEEGSAHTELIARGDAPKRRAGSKPTWEDAMSRVPENELANCRPYSIRDTYETGDLVAHPVFDIGFVADLLPDNKVEIQFRDGPRVLVHNRGDLASRMPGISEIPPPRDAKKKKRSKKKEEPAQPVAVRSKADIDDALDVARAAASAKMDESQRTVSTRLESGKGKAGKGKAPAAPPAKGGGAKGAVAPAKAGAKMAAKPEPAKAAKGNDKKPVKAAAKPAKAAKPAPKKAAPAKKAAKPAPKKAAPAKKAAKPAAKKPAAKKPAKPAKKKK